jgi:co-chaperonin GroES (HSP10)
VWSNKKGFKLMRVCRADGGFDVGAFDAEGELYDAAEKITEKQVEGWLSRYKFSRTDGASFKNLIEYNGEQYWKVDYNHVFALRRNGQIMMVGGYVFVEPVSEIPQSGLIHLLRPIKAENEATARVLVVNEPRKGQKDLGIKPMDIVLYDRRYAQQYNVFGKDVLVLKHYQVLAKLS